MATFAQINNDNIVVHVTKVPNEELMENGIENEQLGIDYLRKTFPWITDRWVQTWFGTTKRGLTAGLGMIYNEQLDRFDLNPDYHGCRTEDLSYDPFGNPDIDPANIIDINTLSEEEKQTLLERIKNG